MQLFDFQIRAWQIDDNHTQVIVHSSPVGGMRKPETVHAYIHGLGAAYKRIRINQTHVMKDTKEAGQGPLRELIDFGKQLAQILLPLPIITLLIRSLERISPDDGLRIRLCLDESLIDLPWEFLYRGDMSDEESLAGFLVLDSRISLVREPPMAMQKIRGSKRKQRMIFAGAFWDGDSDRWQVRKEFDQLSEALEPVKEYIAIEFVKSSGDRIERALMKSSAIFHYSGHTADINGQGFLIREAISSDFGKSPKLYSEIISRLLKKSGTRLGVFSSCNSGRWAFAKPMIQSGLPVFIGVQDSILSETATAFCRKLYSSLAIGLSIDEAVTWARFHVLESFRDSSVWGLHEWGQLMVYMPSTEAVLFPKPRNREIKDRQDSARQERQQSIINVYQNINSVQGGKVIGVLSEKLSSP